MQTCRLLSQEEYRPCCCLLLKWTDLANIFDILMHLMRTPAFGKIRDYIVESANFLVVVGY
jgi:hypothetical protein